MRRDVKGYVKMVKKEQEKLGIVTQNKKPVKKEDMPLKKTPVEEQERGI